MSSVVELTRALVAIDTVNPPGNEAAAAALLGGRLEAAGLAVAEHPFAPGRTSLVARLKGRADRPLLCLTAHLDTVPLGHTPWSHDPFAAELDGDRLYGRGASDMKGGAAAIVVAAERLARAGEPEAGLEIVLCAAEETGCQGARALARAGDALGRVGALLVAEPTSNYPHLAHKGVLWLDVISAGKSAHGSMPQLGTNAIYPLARGITQLERHEFNRSPHELLGEPTLNVGRIAGGVNINSVPDRAVAGIDIRTIPGMEAATVIDELRAVVGDEVELSTVVNLPPVATTGDDPWVHDVFDVLAELTGERPEARGLNYFTDASELTPAYGGPPTVISGPGEAAQAHQTDEHCSVRDLELAVEAYVEIARRWCGL